MEKVYELQSVSFTYPPGQKALDNISFQVEPGERVAVLGANGSGKSTLLKLLAGLLHPSSGSLFAFGQALTEKTMQQEDFAFPFRQRVGFVFQNPDVQLFCGTVRDEVAFGPLQLNLSKEEAFCRIEQVLHLLDILPLAERSPYHLSGGEKKKVALASVLAVNPEILLLDEPTNGLDPQTQDWLLELLFKLREAGKTIIISTHQLELAAQFAGRALVFDEGHRLVADGSPAEILADRELLLRANLIGKNYVPPLF